MHLIADVRATSLIRMCKQTRQCSGIFLAQPLQNLFVSQSRHGISIYTKTSRLPLRTAAIIGLAIDCCLSSMPAM